MLSRRKLITVGATAGAVSLIPPALIKAAAGTTTGSAQSASVSDYLAVTPFSDPSFVSKLSSLFPGLLKDPYFQKMQSHSVLISNVSNHPISAYSTHWKAMTATGGYETLLRHYAHRTSKHHQTARLGVKGNKTRFTGKVPVLAVGETRLLTPYFNWSPDHYQANPKPQWNKILMQSASRQFFLYELSNSTAVKVTIDSVIVNGKTVVGADQANLAKVFRVTRNAEHDEANAILKLVRSGASMDQIASALQDHATSKLPSRRQASHRLYVSVRRRQAQVLSRRLQRSKPEQFLRTLKYLKSQPKTTTRRALTV
jgi:hypothetical protein